MINGIKFISPKNVEIQRAMKAAAKKSAILID